MKERTPEDIFVDDLCQALRNRGRPVGERERKLARTLHPMLWTASYSIQSPEGLARAVKAEESLRSHIEATRAEADTLDKIGRLAAQLLNQLHKPAPRAKVPTDAEVEDPGPTMNRFGRLATGYMTPTGDLLASGPETARALFGLVVGAPRLAATLRASAKRAPGPHADETRRTLSEWVAVALARVGVRPTMAKTGVFARILCVVQRAAGFGDRTLANVERDVRHALNDPSVMGAIARLLATQKPPRKNLNA